MNFMFSVLDFDVDTKNKYYKLALAELGEPLHNPRSLFGLVKVGNVYELNILFMQFTYVK